MRKEVTKRTIRPVMYGVAFFLLLLVITQYASYLRFVFNRQREKDALEQELDETKGHFRDLLTHSISSANTIAILHKQDPALTNFDKVAKQIIEYDNTIAFISFADKYTITHVYPHEGNDEILGHSLLEFPLFRKEVELSITNKKVLFAGPYQLIGGRGLGIACRIPLVANGQLTAMVNVITKLSTIKELLPQLKNDNGKFVFQLTKKNPLTQKSETFLDNYHPRDNQQVAVYIPEGDWVLHVAYDARYAGDKWAYIFSFLGLVISVGIGIFAYHRAKLPEKMQRIINDKTKELATSEKYYRTLIESSTDAIVLFDKDGKGIYRTVSFEKVTGYSIDDMQKMFDIDMVIPEEKEEIRNAFKTLVATPNGIAHRCIRLKHKNGHQIYIDGVYRNMLHDETVRAVVCTYSDVTEREKAYHQLGERMKELSIIFKINDILKDDHQDVDAIFTRIVELLPQGWQFPGDCKARIEFDGRVFASPDYPLSAVKQDAMFRLIDGRSGRIEIIYTTDKPAEDEGPFLKEERDLIETVADTITIYFNKAIQQRAMRESEARFRNAFDHAAIGMSLASLEGQWLRVNQALCEMLGYTEKELMTMSFLSITHPEDVSGDVAAIRQLISGEIKIFRANKRYFHKTGRTVWVNVNVSLLRNEQDEPLYFVSQVNDITEQVESELKFQNLVEKSLVSVYIIQDGKFVYANPTLLEEVGYSEEELFEKNIVDFVYEEDRAFVIRNMDARLQGKLETAHYEVRIQRKNGMIIWAEFYATATVFRGGKAVIGTIINITGRKQLELERQTIIEELLQRNRDLEQFNQILSHNVRAPLATILGLSDLMRHTVSEEENKFIIKGIETSSKQLDIVINDLNDILHARSGLSEAKTMVKLEEILEEIKNLLRQMIKDSQAVIVHDFSAVNEIESVRSFIHSIFFNLVANSIKYAKKEVAPQIRIRSEKQNGHILLEFSDNGIGFDMERYKDQVFVLYKRFHQNIEGRGLGLFMVKTQVEALKGTIEVFSKVGEGTRFLITFK